MCGGCSKKCEYDELKTDLTTLFISFIKGLSNADEEYFKVIENASEELKSDVNEYF